MIYAFLGSYDFSTWLQTWLPIIFMGLLVLLLYKALSTMRTKPQKLKATSAPKIGWEDIAGADEAKEELQEVVEFLRDPKRFQKLGATVPRGVLLHGPPGTGKTLLAKAVAHESGAQFYSQSAASFVEMFAGLGAARIRRLFSQARKHAPSIIFIDELDAVGGKRGMDISGEKDQTLNQLLVEMDGFGESQNVVVIAASNLLDKLDPALLRPGRFDRQILVTPAGVDGRRRILDVHTKNKPLHPSADLDAMARQTSGLSGADLANICNEAAIFCARRGGHSIAHADFETALERVIAGMATHRRLNDHERRVVAFHEAGHALCAELLPQVDPVHKISIVPRGRALGYTLNLPEEDRYLKTREELEAHMVMLLGGRAAERVIFGAVTTGASDDLKRVADVARAMVTEYAMSDTFFSLQISGDQLSDKLLRRRDDEIQVLADEAYQRALEIMVGYRKRLEALAERLLEREMLERRDIDELMEGAETPRPRHPVAHLGLAAMAPPGGADGPSL